LSSEQTTCQAAAVTFAPSVGAVVGENLQRLRDRSQLTQHETARLVAQRGVSWSRSKIAAVEAGERPNLAFADVLMLAHVFNVELAELLEGDGDVTVTPHSIIPRRMLRDLVRGLSVLEGSAQWNPDTRQAELVGLARIRAEDDARRIAPFQGVEADQALALRLGVTTTAVITIATKLWNRTMTAERDARVADLGDLTLGERQAHRGHITRDLAQQIQAQLMR